MPTRNISLTDHYDGFIEDHLTSGKYKNASEVVRAGLAELERREEEDQLKLEEMRLRIEKGRKDLAEGRYTSLETDDEIKDFVMALGRSRQEA